MTNVPDSPTPRPSAHGVGALIAVAILFVLGAILFWQRMSNTISEIRAAEQQHQTQLSDLQRQLQDVQKQIQNAGPGDTVQLSDLQKQLSAEQGERKRLADQLGALSARLESVLRTNAAEPSARPDGTKRRRPR